METFEANNEMVSSMKSKESVLDSNSKNAEEYPDNDTVEILPEITKAKSDLSFKIIVIGNSGVGKTCLALRALKNDFSLETIPTIGFEFMNMNVKLCNKVISLQIWDTCGQEAYQSVVSKFYKRAAMAILVYSIADRKSFDNLDSWLNELKNNASSDIKIALVGNKLDLKGERVVTKEEALNYKISRKLDLIFESSAKHGDNSRDIFTEAAKVLYKDYLNFANSGGFINKASLNQTGYGRLSNPYGANYKLPGKDTVKLEDPGDEFDFDKGQNGSCPKC